MRVQVGVRVQCMQCVHGVQLLENEGDRVLATHAGRSIVGLAMAAD